MTRYLLARAAQAVVVILGVVAITFLLLHALPGNLARTIIGARATPAQVLAFDRANGLNNPLLVQFGEYLERVIHGNWGYSFRQGRPVLQLLAQDLPKDVILVGTSMMLALIIAIPVGIMQAVRRNSLVDHLATAVSFTLYSMPSYVLGLLFIALVSIQFHLLPAEAPQGATIGAILGDPAGLLLPIATLTLITCALFSRYMRAAAIEGLARDYIRTARAKGLPERLVLSRHLLRNALVPVTTLVGLALPSILTAGLVVEQVFNFPGVGLAYFNAATSDDYPVLLGVTLVVGVVTVFGNLLADVFYAVLDPRVRYAGGH